MITVSHKLRLLHIHVPKTGGTTINSVIQEWDPDAKSLTSRSHEPISFIAQAHPEIFNDYLKIACVRNPWARAVSLYRYRQVMAGTNTSPHWPAHWPGKDIVAEMDFRELVEKGAAEPDCEICPPRDANRVVWLEPSCFAWIAIDGAVAVDRILRTEALADDLTALCTELGLSPTAIPHLNQSHRSPYQPYYDSTSRDSIAQRYRKDIDAFGYEFDPA